MNLISIISLFVILVLVWGYTHIKSNENYKDNLNTIQNDINVLDIDKNITEDNQLSDINLIDTNKKISSYKKRTNIITLYIKETWSNAKIIFDKPVSLNYMVDVDNIDWLTSIEKNKLKTLYFEVIWEKEWKRINFNEISEYNENVDLDEANKNNLNLDNDNFNMSPLFWSTKEYDSNFNIIDNHKIKELDFTKENNINTPLKIVIYTDTPIYYEVQDMKISNIVNKKTILWDSINMYNSSLYNVY